jgi:prevent-host-death family protein
VSALDVRRKFGEIVDAAANGERIVIERAGQPVAALVPLADLALVDPERRKAERMAALEELRRYVRAHPAPDVDIVSAIREAREERDRKATQGLRP